jgi:sugar (pentulose or hexulose) kinase
MGQQHLLGVDLGTTAIKAALFDGSGRRVAASTREYPLLTPAPQVVEQEVEVYWRAFRDALAAVLASGGVAPGRIRALGISAQGETLIAADRQGRALAPAIVWMDNRAQRESDELAAALGNQLVHEVTGQVGMLPMWPASKVLWLRRNRAELFGRTHKFLLIEDWFIHRLTGRFVAEGSLLCSTTWWELATKRYWPRMLQELGIGEEQLPEVVEPGQAIGTIRREVAEELGLAPSTIVATGALDQACGALGVGNVRPGIFSECTGSNVGVVTLVERPRIDPLRQMPCFYYGLADTYMMHAFSMTGGMVLRWFRDGFCAEAMKEASAAGTDPYELLTREASGIPAGAEGLVLLPHFQGAGLPEANPRARGVLYGLSLHHTRAHVLRAILESVALICRRMIDAVRDLGIGVGEIRSLGGGAKSALWCQIKADLTGLPVTTTRNTEDAACLGAAVLAGAAVGAWPSAAEALSRIVEVDRRFDPDPRQREPYERLYADYRRLYDCLLPMFSPR